MGVIVKHKEVTWYQKARQQEQGVARRAKESLALVPGSFKGKSKDLPGIPRTGSKGLPEIPSSYPIIPGNPTLIFTGEHFGFLLYPPAILLGLSGF